MCCSPGAMSQRRWLPSARPHCPSAGPLRSSNTVWQRGILLNYGRIGDALLALGDGAAALASFRESLAVAEALVDRDPANTDWQSNLAVSYNRIGNVLLAQGDDAAALVAFRHSQTVVEALVRIEPANADWQSNLSVGHSRIGEVLLAQGDSAEALTEFRLSLAIAEALTDHDPANTFWQRDLMFRYFRFAQVIEATNPAGAMVWWRKAFKRLDEMNRLRVMNPSDHNILDFLRQKVSGGNS